MEFADRTVVVTGASGHLGQAVAAAFAERGANLVLVARSVEHLAARFGPADARRLYVAADLARQDDADALAQAAVDRFGGIDVLCNVAGGFRAGASVHETDDDAWRFLCDVNVRTLICAARAIVPRMLARGHGKIVNVAAHAALHARVGMGAYAATKAAVVRLTEAMAAELRERAINVNCVLPTTLDTPENRRAMPDVDPARLVAPADLACIIVFLASAAARPIHGAALPVTGLV